jgi:hypothetical protein
MRRSQSRKETWYGKSKQTSISSSTTRWKQYVIRSAQIYLKKKLIATQEKLQREDIS